MDMSAAALPPNQPRIDEADRQHPLFAKYMEHRASCARLLVRADSFADWLTQHEAAQVRDAAAQHPQYPAFRSWMRLFQGGARKCPAGNTFPQNFEYWLDGGRW